MTPRKAERRACALHKSEAGTRWFALLGANDWKFFMSSCHPGMPFGAVREAAQRKHATLAGALPPSIATLDGAHNV
jgi:hypothetical protein